MKIQLQISSGEFHKHLKIKNPKRQKSSLVHEAEMEGRNETEINEMIGAF